MRDEREEVRGRCGGGMREKEVHEVRTWNIMCGNPLIMMPVQTERGGTGEGGEIEGLGNGL